MRIIVTGASGFIGRETVALLCDQGHEVHALARNKGEESRAHWHVVDLLDDDPGPLLGKIGATHLLHLAWYAVPGRYWTAEENLDWVAASLRLARAFSASGGHRLVIAGTCAEYDWSNPRLDECATPLAPATLYGEAKASLYRLLMSARAALDLSLGWGRIFNVYGPLERPERLLGTLIRAARACQPAHFSAGTQLRDFLHVDDVARAFAALLISPIEGAVNIGSGQPASIRSFIEIAARYCAAESLVEFGDPSLARDEPPSLYAGMDRLTGELGFEARYDLETGIALAVRRALSN